MVGTRKEDLLGGMGSVGTRSHLLKATRRLGRSIRTEAKLFLQRPSRRRWWTRPFLITMGVLAVVGFLGYLLWPGEIQIQNGAIHRESSHFTHNQRILPMRRQRGWESASLGACSWVYLEVNAGDGRHLREYFTNGNAFLEEYLRASQAAMRGFCAVAVETDPQMEVPLEAVRSEKGVKASKFDVFAGVTMGKSEGVEEVRLRLGVKTTGEENRVVGDLVEVRRVSLVETIRKLTFKLEDSGGEGGRSMSIGLGNRQNGTVVVRLNVEGLREAYWYLSMLESSGVLCERIDRLVINLQAMSVDNTRHLLIDRKVLRNYDALIGETLDERYELRQGVEGIKKIAEDISATHLCRAVVYVLDTKGELIHPKPIAQREVFYAVLAGHPTFDERIAAQTSSWMEGVPKDRVAIYTNVQRSKDELAAARGRVTIVTKPSTPEREQQLQMMQSWSHLVRVRETWDRFMRDDESVKWLMLVDDDTFVFPGGMREYLSSFDHRRRVWGGSGEQARIDNGDHGKFATWLRNLSMSHGGKHCYLPQDDIPEALRGRKIEYSKSRVMNGRRVAHVVSHMCSDAFCKRGCPAVPQGAAIFLSRALVSALRPHVEACERDTATLCKNCGSQRLYMCVNHYIPGAATLMTRGICRATWRLERREMWPFALTYHGFQKYKHITLATQSIQGDMQQLWQLAQAVEGSVRAGKRKSMLVPISRVADVIGCRGLGTYRRGKCITEDGTKMDAHDGSAKEHESRPGERAADRMGSA